MAMAGIGTRHGITGINVTPLIDVLLVLLVIFMVIVPVTPRGLSSSIPQPAKQSATDTDAIVVQITAAADGALRYQINQTPLGKAELEGRLVGIFASRQQKAMFVKADRKIEYASVAEVIDMGHRASVDTMGLLTPALQNMR